MMEVWNSEEEAVRFDEVTFHKTEKSKRDSDILSRDFWCLEALFDVSRLHTFHTDFGRGAEAAKLLKSCYFEKRKKFGPPRKNTSLRNLTCQNKTDSKTCRSLNIYHHPLCLDQLMFCCRVSTCRNIIHKTKKVAPQIAKTIVHVPNVYSLEFSYIFKTTMFKQNVGPLSTQKWDCPVWTHHIPNHLNYTQSHEKCVTFSEIRKMPLAAMPRPTLLMQDEHHQLIASQLAGWPSCLVMPFAS